MIYLRSESLQTISRNHDKYRNKGDFGHSVNKRH